MGIDKVNSNCDANVILPRKTVKAHKEVAESPVVRSAEKPAADTVNVTNPIPEWASVEKSDGKIGDFKQGTTGDCWLLATLIALKLAGAEEKFLTSRIKKKDGKLQVSFGSQKEQKVFSFSQQEIKDRMLHPEEEIIDYTVAQGGEFLRDIIKKHNSKRLEMESIRRLRELNVLTDADIPKAQGGKHLRIPHIFGKLSSGDIDVVAFEMAQEKFIGKEMEGDYASTALKNIVGRPVTAIYFDSGKATTGTENAPNDESKSMWGLFNYAYKRKKNIAMTASTGDRPTDPTLFKGHAYAVDIQKTNRDFVYLINPHDSSKTIRMPMSNFKSNFLRVSIADLSDYQTYTVKEGDNLSKIAAAKGLKPEDLMLANPTLKSVDALKINQKLNIPVIK